MRLVSSGFPNGPRGRCPGKPRRQAPAPWLLAGLVLLLAGLSGGASGSLAGGSGTRAGLPAAASGAGAGAESLVILHTNDLHSHLIPFHRADTSSVGGAAARAELIRRERERTPDLLLLDAGDVIQGTPAYNLFRGVPDVRALSLMRYDVVALGNHDLDDGPGAWARLVRDAAYPVVSANVFAASESSFVAPSSEAVPQEIREGARWVGGKRVDDSAPLRFLARPYVIRSWRGRKIAILGLTTDRLVNIVRISANRGVAVTDPVRVARLLVPRLRREADLVVALTHIGLEEDRRLARDVPGIDLIVGGHSHTRLDAPAYGTDDAEGPPIVQTGAWGDRLGRSVIHLAAGRPDGFTYRLLPVKPSDGEDPEIAALTRPVADSVRAIMGETIYVSEEFYPQPRRNDVETPIGNFAADVLRESTGADAAIVNTGGIRAPIPRGPVTVADVYSTFPFDNTIVVVPMTGSKLRRLLDFIARRVGKGDFAQVSGLTFDITRDYASDVRVGGRTLQSDRVYRIATIDFLYEGGAGYSIFREAGPAEATGLFQNEAAVSFLRRNPRYRFRTDGRIAWEGSTPALRDLQTR
jgi:5'-nucleotidase / UDP-sugar diphosphatase